VAPPGDKFNNSVFHWQNQARPLHSNDHFMLLVYSSLAEEFHLALLESFPQTQRCHC